MSKRLIVSLALLAFGCGLTPPRGRPPVYVPPVVVQPEGTVLDVPAAEPVAAPRPTREQVLDYRGCLGTLRDAAGRAVWTPALPGAPADVRDEWLSLLKAAGCTHVPIGPFGPGPSYPGIVAWDNPDWRFDAVSIRALVTLLLDRGFVPVVFTDGGPRDPKPRLRALFPVLADALDGLDASVIVLPAGWEPVVGDFTSAEVSWALETWHALRPDSIIGFHGSPERLVGSSNPIEPDDPWQGGEATFYTEHGGQYIQIALYQAPHGNAIYSGDCNEDNEDGSCWLNRFQDYVQRLGTGFHGWRVVKVVAFELTTYEVTRGKRSADEAKRVTDHAMRVCAKWRVSCGWGDGPPSVVPPVAGDALTLSALPMDLAVLGSSPNRVFWRVGVPFTANGSRTERVAALTDHVSYVVELGSEKQMVWPHAGGHVALVADLLPRRNVSVRELPRVAVRVHDEARTNTELAISEYVRAGSPKPASFCFVDLAPEPDLWRHLGARREQASLRAVSASAFDGEIVRRKKDLFPTRFALTHDALYRWRHVPIVPALWRGFGDGLP